MTFLIAVPADHRQTLMVRRFLPFLVTPFNLPFWFLLQLRKIVTLISVGPLFHRARHPSARLPALHSLRIPLLLLVRLTLLVWPRLQSVLLCGNLLCGPDLLTILLRNLFLGSVDHIWHFRLSLVSYSEAWPCGLLLQAHFQCVDLFNEVVEAVLPAIFQCYNCFAFWRIFLHFHCVDSAETIWWLLLLNWYRSVGRYWRREVWLE